jgi:hypothetical protein
MIRLILCNKKYGVMLVKTGPDAFIQWKSTFDGNLVQNFLV